MEHFTYPHENVSLNSTDELKYFISVPELAKELEFYKISQFVYNYSAVPISVFGSFGNFFSSSKLFLLHYFHKLCVVFNF